MRNSTGSVRMSLLRLFGITVVILAVAAVLFPMFARTHCVRTGTVPTCLDNLRQLGTAFSIYQCDWDDRLPVLVTKSAYAGKDRGWTSKVLVYAKNRMMTHCPLDPTSARGPEPHMPNLSYSMNRQLSGMKEKYIGKPADVALLWDTVSTDEYCDNTNSDHVWRWENRDWPKHGDYVAWPEHAEKECRNWPLLAQPRHPGGVNNVLFADGHAEICKPGIVPRMSPR